MSADDESDPILRELQGVKYPDSETLRILLLTDTHLGVHESDPVRGLDSFRALDEALAYARKYQCDLALHGGDLFDKNRPSRHTILKATEILRRHCLGDRPVHFQLVPPYPPDLSEEDERYRVNFHDPNLGIGLPLFIIHGNHDDPCGFGNHTALEQLSEAGLVNYFGRQKDLSDIEIYPLLLRKGMETAVALYGLGHIRDERLHRAFAHRKVRWVEPSAPVSMVNDEGDDDEGESEDEEESSKKSKNGCEWFNLCVIHQNRSLSRSGVEYKNGIQPSMLAKMMDVVVWAHEHECKIELDAYDGSSGIELPFWITQPGSTVSCCLRQSEANAMKYCCILEVRKDQCRLIPIPLKSTRPFLFSDVILKEKMDNDDSSVLLGTEQNISDKLAQCTEELLNNSTMMNEYFPNCKKPLMDQFGEKDLDLLCPWHQKLLMDAKQQHIDGDSNDSNDEKRKDPLRLPLLRVRVEHTGFDKIRPAVFGHRFDGRVANPSTILSFYRKASLHKKGGKMGKSTMHTNLFDLDGILGKDGDDESGSLLMMKMTTEQSLMHFMNQTLSEEKHEILSFEMKDLMEAVTAVAEKDDSKAIDRFVNDTLKKDSRMFAKLNIESSEQAHLDYRRERLMMKGNNNNISISNEMIEQTSQKKKKQKKKTTSDDTIREGDSEEMNMMMMVDSNNDEKDSLDDCLTMKSASRMKRKRKGKRKLEEIEESSNEQPSLFIAEHSAESMMNENDQSVQSRNKQTIKRQRKLPFANAMSVKSSSLLSDDQHSMNMKNVGKSPDIIDLGSSSDESIKEQKKKKEQPSKPKPKPKKQKRKPKKRGKASINWD